MKKLHLITLGLIILAPIFASAQLINWETETGLTAPSAFVDGQIITNFAGTGLDVRINVNTVDGFPRISVGNPTTVITGGDRTDVRFTLTFLNGTADVRLDNFENLQRGERITLSNPDMQDIILQQTSNNGGARMQVDGVTVPALNTDVVQDANAVVREANDGAGTQWYATMSSITSFTWEYDALFGVSATEGLQLTLSAVVLPINLIHFNADITEENKVDLSWQTAAEINNDNFTVEHSKNRVNWSKVAQIKGAGNSSAVLSYFLTDNNPYSELSYYRLKQTDFDGTTTYSDVKSVVIDEVTNSQIKIYPNPTFNTTIVKGNDSELKELAVYDIFGQDITSTVMNHAAINTTQISIDLSNVPQGLYLIQTKTSVSKVFKK